MARARARRRSTPADEIEPVAYTVASAAAALQTSTDTVRRMIRAGELPSAWKLRAQWRIPVAAIDELVRSNGKTTTSSKRKTTTKRTPTKRAR